MQEFGALKAVLDFIWAPIAFLMTLLWKRLGKLEDQLEKSKEKASGDDEKLHSRINGLNTAMNDFMRQTVTKDDLREAKQELMAAIRGRQ